MIVEHLKACERLSEALGLGKEEASLVYSLYAYNFCNHYI